MLMNQWNNATLTSRAFTLRPAPAPLDFFGGQEEGSRKRSSSLYEWDVSLSAFKNSESSLLAGLFRRGVRWHVHSPTHVQKCLDV